MADQGDEDTFAAGAPAAAGVVVGLIRQLLMYLRKPPPQKSSPSRNPAVL